MSRPRRERGQARTYLPGNIVVKPQSYERGLIGVLLQALLNLALVRTERKELEAAVRLMESIVAVDAEYLNNASLAFVLGSWYYAQGQFDRAEPLLRRSSESAPRPDWRTKALFYRAMIVRRKGDEPEAQRLLRAALATPGLDDAGRATIEKELKSP
jgi:tetratricopeptide (TPR) repeat protein